MRKLAMVSLLVAAASSLAAFRPGNAADSAQSGAAPATNAPGKRLVLLDDDVGFDAYGCFQDGFVQQYEEANPDYHPKNPAFAAIARACDTDGGLELIYNAWIADTRDDVDLLGVTTVHGVSTSRVTYHSAKELLRRMGRSDIPVYQGAPDGASSLGVATDAVRFIIDAVMAHPGQVEIIATGPLTNIATAMMLEPRLTDTWKAIYFGSGNFNDELVKGYKHLGEDLGQPEMNANMDPEAMRYVVDHAHNAIWISGEATEIHPWCFSLFDDWPQVAVSGLSGSPFHKYVAEQLLPWLIATATVGNKAVGGSWENGCGADSGTTASSLVYFPEYRGQYLDSAIAVVEDASMNDGSVANSLSRDPSKPVQRIYYSVNAERMSELHDDAIAAINYYPAGTASYLDDFVVPWVHLQIVPSPLQPYVDQLPVETPNGIAEILDMIMERLLAGG